MMSVHVIALTCSTCGAPLDLGRMSGGRLDCNSCGSTSSAEERGLTRLRTFRLPSLPTGTAEAWVAEAALRLGFTPSAVQAWEVVHSFVARAGLAEGLLYGTQVVHRKSLSGSYREEVDRFLAWNYSGHMAVRADSTAPVVWLNLPHASALIGVAEELVSDVELSLRNFDEFLRVQIGTELERTACASGWTVVRVNVTVDTSGELFMLRVPFVWVRFQVARPGGAKILVPVAANGWYELCYAFDGRVVSGALPTARLNPVVWLLVAVGLAAMGVVFALAFALL